MVTILRIFSPCFKTGQNLSSCQVSGKSVHRFSQMVQTSPYTYIYIYIHMTVPGANLKFSVPLVQTFVGLT